MTNNKILTRGFLIFIIALGIFTIGIYAQAAAPGSEGDPLVSKSYVDSRINQIIAMINSTPLSAPPVEQGIDIEKLKQDIINELSILKDLTFVPVNVTRNQIILGGEGTEFILRSGRAVAYCVGAHGMVNATNGTEVQNGAEIPRNHLILVPRDDGRGVRVTTNEAWFIIKGNYQIVELP